MVARLTCQRSKLVSRPGRLAEDDDVPFARRLVHRAVALGGHRLALEVGADRQRRVRAEAAAVRRRAARTARSRAADRSGWCRTATATTLRSKPIDGVTTKLEPSSQQARVARRRRACTTSRCSACAARCGSVAGIGALQVIVGREEGHRQLFVPAQRQLRARLVVVVARDRHEVADVARGDAGQRRGRGSSRGRRTPGAGGARSCVDDERRRVDHVGGDVAVRAVAAAAAAARRAPGRPGRARSRRRTSPGDSSIPLTRSEFTVERRPPT